MTRPTLTPAAGLTFVLVLAAIGYGAEQVWWMLRFSGVGIDFVPLRHASADLLAGSSIYTDHNFVYPPTAAVLLLPTTLGSEASAAGWWAVTCVFALVIAAVLICGAAPRRLRLRALALAVLGLLSSSVMSQSMGIENLSVSLVPVAVGALIAFEKERWLLGCTIVIASLLIKPLLLPLLLVPVVRGRWREIVTVVIPAGVILMASVVLVPGGTEFLHVLRYCASGTNLHGTNARNNLSLQGWFEAHHQAHLLGLVLAVLLLSASVFRIVSLHRHFRHISPARLASFAFLTTLLASSISELNYLLVVIGMCGVVVVVERQPMRLLAVGPGLIMMSLPPGVVDLFVSRPVAQTWYIACELCLYAGTFATLPARRAVSETPDYDRVSAVGWTRTGKGSVRSSTSSPVAVPTST